MLDHLSHNGAHLLARRIQAYWAERGVTVSTTLTPISRNGGIEHIPGAVWCVRSTLTGQEQGRCK